MLISDKELLEAIGEKDEKAFNEFYKRYSPLLYEWMYNRIGTAEATDDALQNFWSNFWLNPTMIKTDTKGSSKKFLFHFYTYRVLDYFRKINNKNRLFSSGTDPDGDDDYDNTLSYTHVLEELQAKEIHQIIDETISHLPELTRKIFEYRWEMNYSVKETAEQLQIDEKTVYNRMFRTLDEIRSQLKTFNTDDSKLYQSESLLVVGLLLSLFK